MSSQISENTGQAPRFPPDLTVFGLPCSSPPVNQDSSQDKTEKKKENQRESLKTIPPSYPPVQVHLSISIKGGQEAKRWVLKSESGGDDDHLQM